MMKFARLPLVAAVLVVAGSGCSLSQTQPAPPPRGGGDVNTSTLQTTGANTLTGEVWVDNWFSLWVNGRKLIEDSVPITTERSVNPERFPFKADAPDTFVFEFRDFMQDETGLEYIGTGRQQMGDGGAIAQFTDATSGQVIATTDGSWRCLVVHMRRSAARPARNRRTRSRAKATAPRKRRRSWTDGPNPASTTAAGRRQASTARARSGRRAVTTPSPGDPPQSSSGAGT